MITRLTGEGCIADTAGKYDKYKELSQDSRNREIKLRMEANSGIITALSNIQSFSMYHITPGTSPI